MCHFLAPLGQPKMMHKNFMHEHKSKMGVPPTHEVLYWLQISQHQLQKDVTHLLDLLFLILGRLITGDGKIHPLAGMCRGGIILAGIRRLRLLLILC